MKRLAVVALAALTLVASTTPEQKTASTASTDKEIRQANQLPKQNARPMETPYKGIGCIWPVSFDPAKVSAPNQVSATCDALPSGKAYVVRINSRIPLAKSPDTGVKMRLRASAPGFDQEIVVKHIQRLPEAQLFSGAAKGKVPNGGAVEVKFNLIGCTNAADAAVPCPFGSGNLFVLFPR